MHYIISYMKKELPTSSELAPSKLEAKNMEEYQTLLEEIKAAIVETKYSASIEIIKGRWEIGKSIVDKENLFERAGYGDKVVQYLAEDMQVSPSSLWKMMQFYRQYPRQTFEQVQEELPQGKAISWFYITQNILTNRAEDLGEQIIAECPHFNISLTIKCKDCKSIIKFDNANLDILTEEQKNILEACRNLIHS